MDVFCELLDADRMIGVNAIRAYNLDPNLNHDGCASIFNAVRSAIHPPRWY